MSGPSVTMPVDGGHYPVTVQVNPEDGTVLLEVGKMDDDGYFSGGSTLLSVEQWDELTGLVDLLRHRERLRGGTDATAPVSS